MESATMQGVHDRSMDMLRTSFCKLPTRNLDTIFKIKACIANAYMAGFHAANKQERLDDGSTIHEMRTWRQDELEGKVDG